MKGAIAVTTLSLVLAASQAHAQIGRVAGTVTDEEGRPLKGATVTAENRDQSPSTFTSSSDAKGRFSILGMRRGLWMFTIQSPGFEKATTRLDVFTTRPNPPLNVQLARATTAAAPGPLAGIDAKGIQRQIDGAESLAASGEYAAAIAAYRALLAQVPALTSIHLQIGALYERLHDTPAALDAYRRLAALEPDNAAARAAIERLSGR